jgi:hypothetical protein
MARTLKMHPQTKHININYHHFLERVSSGLLSLHMFSTDKQVADIFTKALTELLYLADRKSISGWQQNKQ